MALCSSFQNFSTIDNKSANENRPFLVRSLWIIWIVCNQECSTKELSCMDGEQKSRHGDDDFFQPFSEGYKIWSILDSQYRSITMALSHIMASTLINISINKSSTSNKVRKAIYVGICVPLEIKRKSCTMWALWNWPMLVQIRPWIALQTRIIKFVHH